MAFITTHLNIFIAGKTKLLQYSESYLIAMMKLPRTICSYFLQYLHIKMYEKALFINFRAYQICAFEVIQNVTFCKSNSLFQIKA